MPACRLDCLHNALAAVGLAIYRSRSLSDPSCTHNVGGTDRGAREFNKASGVKRPRDWAVTILLSISVPYSAYAIIKGRAEAQRRIHVDFDSACQWITNQARESGPILTQYPGEVFWQTGHETLEPGSDDPRAISRLIDRLGVDYLLIDEERYANASTNPLRGYVTHQPDRVRLVWSNGRGSQSVQVFQIVRPKQSPVDSQGSVH